MARILNPLAAALGALLLAAPAFAAGDAARGAAAFRTQCAACHTATQGGPARVGPNLFGVVDTKAASRPGFRYSQAMQNIGLTWDSATLARYLTAPRRVVPGTAMSFMGTDDADESADLAAYLATLK